MREVLGVPVSIPGCVAEWSKFGVTGNLKTKTTNVDSNPVDMRTGIPATTYFFPCTCIQVE